MASWNTERRKQPDRRRESRGGRRATDLYADLMRALDTAPRSNRDLDPKPARA